jgi:hypothetical protein
VITKQLESLNRRTRIVKSLLSRECKHEIAKRESVSASYVAHIAQREAIPVCSHARAGHECVKPL